MLRTPMEGPAFPVSGFIEQGHSAGRLRGGRWIALPIVHSMPRDNACLLSRIEMQFDGLRRSPRLIIDGFDIPSKTASARRTATREAGTASHDRRETASAEYVDGTAVGYERLEQQTFVTVSGRHVRSPLSAAPAARDQLPEAGLLRKTLEIESPQHGRTIRHVFGYPQEARTPTTSRDKMRAIAFPAWNSLARGIITCRAQ